MAARNFELITVLEKPEKEIVYHRFVKKHIAAKLIIAINLIDNSVRYKVQWNTSKLRGKNEYLKIKDAIEYYNTL
jgi:hypothetical protein